jgi:hypothetical protein
MIIGKISHLSFCKSMKIDTNKNTFTFYDSQFFFGLNYQMNANMIFFNRKLIQENKFM